MKRLSRRVLWWSGASAITLILALLALLRSIPYFVEKAALKASIEKGLQESFGVHFRIEELTLEPTLFQGLQANLNTTLITDVEHDPLGDIRHITVSIPYWPLLMERVPVIAKIHLDEVRIPIARKSLFKEVKIHFKEPEKKGFIKPAELRDTEILISNAEVADLILPVSVHEVLPSVRHFHLGVDEISIRHLKSDNPISVLGNGVLAYSYSPHPKRKPLRFGNYEVFVEIPQSVTEKGHTFTAADIARMEIKVRDSYPGLGLGMDVNYRHPYDMPTGVGSVKSGKIDLTRLQTLALQLSDTLGFPLPDVLKQMYAAGLAEISDGFLISFANPNKPTVSLSDGLARLTNVRISRTKPAAPPMLNGLSGPVNIRNARLYLQNMRLNLGDIPLALDGMYDTRTEAVNAIVSTRNLQIVKLRRTLAALGVPLDALRGRELQGILDMVAQIGGTLQNPTYRGIVALKHGQFRDEALGLQIGGMDARLRFQGAGVKRPGLRYAGVIDLRQGRLSQVQRKRVSGSVAVGSIKGRVYLVGAVPPGGKPALPEATGTLHVAGGRYQVPDSDVLVHSVQGTLHLDRTSVRLENFQGRLDGTPFRLAGTISTNLKRYDVGLTANNVNISRFRREVLAKLPQSRELLRQVQPQSGVADAHVRITAGPGGIRDPRIQGRIRLQALALRSQFLDDLVRIPATTLFIADNRVVVPQTAVQYGPLTLQAKGAFRQPGQYRLDVDSKGIPVDILHDRSIQRLIGRQLGKTPTVWNTAGNMDLSAAITQRQMHFTVDFHDAGLSWKGGAFPLYDLNGRLFYQKPAGAGNPVIATRDLAVRYGNSPVALQLASRDNVRFAANGVLSPLLLNRTLADPQARTQPYREIPFQAAANGKLALLSSSGGKKRGNNLQAGLFVDLSRNLQLNDKELVAAPPVQEPDQTNVQAASGAIAMAATTADSPYLSASAHLLDDDLNIQNGVLHLGDAGDVRADGMIQNVFEPNVPAFRLHLFTPEPLKLDRLDYKTEAVADFIRNMKGTLGADVQVAQGQSRSAGAMRSGKATPPQSSIQNGINGWLNADRIAIPPLGLEEMTGRVNFAGQGATATLDRFIIPGLNTSLTASANDLFSAPVTLDTLNIRGSLFDLERLIAYNQDTLQPVILKGIAHALPQKRNQSAELRTMPIRFYDAPVHFDEAILQNVITKNLVGSFSLHENGFLAMTGLQLEAAGGDASGQFFMNPWLHNFMALDLNVREVRANALTQALLNVSGAVYGHMAGQVRFTTFGDTNEDLLNNANGGVSMSILEGRLPAIARVETLLVAANIIRGGVLGLNLNNLLRALMFYERNYFAEMSGDMDIVNGVMYTNNTKVEGRDLDLYIRGGVRLDDGAVNMIVNGVMQQNVSGFFGFLGKLSPNSLIRVLPALGTWGGSTPGIISYIPGVGYIPGLGGRVGDVSRFQVRIAGKLDNPNAIQGFHWVGAQASEFGE